jgi:nickel/cobalt exporter
MKILSIAFGLLLAIPPPVAAHRLDEYLQAARVAIAADRVALELDLSPGIQVAPHVWSLIDRDADRGISALELEAYARQVLRDVVLDVDGQVVALTLTRAEAPPLGEIIDGIGTIRLEASATVRRTAGRHRLFFRNNHQDGISAYLVNALKPPAGELGIDSQMRDERQREIVVVYGLAPTGQRLLFLLFGGSVLGALVVFRNQALRLRPVPHV